MTFAQLKQNVKDNLNDQGVFFSQSDLDTSFQHAYNIIVALSQCILKKVTLNFQANRIYYNFQDNINFPEIYVPDYMVCTAIFSNQTNLWLLDDKALKDFERDRVDWELWTGNAIWWAPTNDYRRIAVIPYQITASKDFDLYYWAQAETIVDVNSPTIPNDFQYLVELYVTASMLEVAQEFVKAQKMLDDFYGIKDNTQNFDSGIYALADRAKNAAKADLLLLA